ncbi:MAG TPA: hypothetical protein PKU78_06845, partial [Candidatus Dojkabacteria bacterium]|nr:hypothetical protein [Candidatus Dojkabacteria bacterium]
MPKNTLINRLRNSGYIVDRVDTLAYSETDTRQWTALIDSRGTNIFMTVYKNGAVTFYDGEQYTDTLDSYNFTTPEEFVVFLH